MSNDLRIVDPEGNEYDISIFKSDTHSIQVEPGYRLEFYGMGGAEPALQTSGNDLVVGFPSGGQVRLESYATSSTSGCAPKIAYHKEPLSTYIEQAILYQEEQKEKNQEKDDENKPILEKPIEENKEDKPNKDKPEKKPILKPDPDLNEGDLPLEPLKGPPPPPANQDLLIKDSGFEQIDDTLNQDRALNALAPSPPPPPNPAPKPNLTPIENPEVGQAPPPPKLKVLGFVVDEEQHTAAFKVKLSHPVAHPVDVIANTVNGTANPPSDYSPVNNALIKFAPGETEKDIIINILQDFIKEPTEFFSLILSNPINAIFESPTAIGTIIDNTLTEVNGEPSGGDPGSRAQFLGDINNDGFDDAFIASSTASGSQGEGYIIFGSPNGLPASLNLGDLFATNGGNGSQGQVLRPAATAIETGFSISGLGDINGDGIDDLIICDRGNGSNSHASILFGKSGPFTAEFLLSNLESINGGDGSQGIVLINDLNQSPDMRVAGAGDLNGDGINDVLLSTYQNTPSQTLVIFGKNSGFPAEKGLRDYTISGGGDGSEGVVFNAINSSDAMGFSIAAAGDVNGDGIDDIIIGAPNAPSGGEAYLIFGKSTGFSAELDLSDLQSINGGDGSKGIIIRGASVGEQAGFSVKSAGDVNGDGFDDLIIGAPLADPDGQTDSGVVYVLFGKSTSTIAEFDLQDLFVSQGGDGSQGFVIKGVGPNDATGYSVSRAGDINGDGLDDIVLGAPDADAAMNTDSGVVTVILGKPNFAAEIAIGSLNSPDGKNTDGLLAFERFGATVSDAGDINGDGLADIILSAPGALGGNGQHRIIYGADRISTITHRGADGNDILKGSTGPDIMVGGQGNDLFESLGGPDILIGGAGEDDFIIKDGAFRKIDGGRGHDRLELDTESFVLDFDQIAQNKVISIEEIDITGTGNNTLKLNYHDLLDLTDANNSLIIKGDAGDSVDANLSGEGFTNLGIQGGFTHYSNGSAALMIDIDIDQSGVIL